MNFLEMVNKHGWDREDLVEQRNHASLYKEFEEGFIMLVPQDTYDILVATSEGDNHSMDMWRDIRSILKGRKRPVITQYERNYDKLLKASMRYGAVALNDYIVVFP